MRAAGMGGAVGEGFWNLIRAAASGWVGVGADGCGWVGSAWRLDWD